MRFPESFIQEVVDRTDIEELVSRYVTLKRSGSNLVACCPFHSEKTPSFTVTPAKKMFFCFGCHAGGSVITFVQKAENLDFPEAVEFLANRAGLPLPKESDVGEERGVPRRRILDANLEAAKFFRACLFDENLGREAREYLVGKRGLSEATIKHFGLGFAPNQFHLLLDHMHKKGFRDEELVAACLAGQKNGRTYDYFRNRVIFPIIDPSGQVVAFGGRVMDDSKPKYLNSSDTPAFKKSRQLFALNFAKSCSAERMILCEGYLDVIALHQAGFEYAVATLGTAITPEHARIFTKYTKRVVISYDADEAGQNAAEKAMRILGDVGMEVRVLKVPGAKDPDEFIRKYGANRFRQILDESKTGFEHKAERIFSNYDLTVATDRIRATSEICSVIADYYSPVEREVYIGETSKRLGLPADVLKNSVEQIRRKRARDHKAEDSREAQATLKNFRDPVNPEAAKHLHAAAAEEAVLGLLLLYPEYRTIVERQEIELNSDSFLTEFHKRVFEAVMELHKSEYGFRFEFLDERFTPEEVGRIKRLEVERSKLTNNGIEVFRSAVSALQNSREKENASGEDLAARIERLRNKSKKTT